MHKKKKNSPLVLMKEGRGGQLGAIIPRKTLGSKEVWGGVIISPIHALRGALYF